MAAPASTGADLVGLWVVGACTEPMRHHLAEGEKPPSYYGFNTRENQKTKSRQTSNIKKSWFIHKIKRYWRTPKTYRQFVHKCI